MESSLKQENSDKVDITVLIPLYNEEESIPELCSALAKILKDQEKSYELLFVDDGSTDRSLEMLLEQKNLLKEIRIIEFQSNYGKSAALSAGFKQSTGEIVITMDGDLQDDPEEIPNLLKKIDEGYDLVSGWKKTRKDPFIKKFTSKFFNFVTSLVGGIHLHDHNCGLKAYKAVVAKNVNIYGELHRYVPVLAHAAGFKVTEIPVIHHYRKYGKSKYGIWRFFAGFFDLLTVSFITKFTHKPMHLFGFAGLFFFFFGFMINLYLTYQKYIHNQGLSNRPLLFFGILLILIGLQFFSIGLLGEMIASTRKSEDNYLVKTKHE